MAPVGRPRKDIPFDVLVELVGKRNARLLVQLYPGYRIPPEDALLNYARRQRVIKDYLRGYTVEECVLKYQLKSRQQAVRWVNDYIHKHNAKMDKPKKKGPSIASLSEDQ